MFITLRCLSKQ